MKKIFLCIVAFIVLLTVTACGEVVPAEPSAPEQEEEVAYSLIFDPDPLFYGVYFGSYPQTQVTDTAIGDALTHAAGELPSSANKRNWTSYGYYRHGIVENFMWYIDLTHEGAKYRGVYFTEYRPADPMIYYADGSVESDHYQDVNGYNKNTVYWFKFEPIKWRILNVISLAQEDALLFSETVLDCQPFDFCDGNYRNDYTKSTIRSWLNDTFYETAFNVEQKEMVVKATVRNDAFSAGRLGKYDASEFELGNTEDKVFLLSIQEATYGNYSFFSSESKYGPLRKKQNTDYARAQGSREWENTTSDDDTDTDNGFWWLRTKASYGACRCVQPDGFAERTQMPYRSDIGVVPAIRVHFPEDLQEAFASLIE